MRNPVSQRFELYQRQRFLDPLFQLLPAYLACLQSKCDVPCRRKMRKQRIALEDHTYVAPIRRFGGDISPTEQNASFCRRNESGDNSQASSFPAATWSKNCEKFAFLDPDIEISNGFEISECLMQLSQLDTGHS